MMKNYRKKKNTIRTFILMFVVTLFFNSNNFGQAITYTFANAQITNDGSDNFYEADVLIESTTSFQLGPWSLYITYNTSAFGTNIVAAGGLTVTEPPGSVADDGLIIAPAAKVYADNPPVDNHNFRFNVTWLQAFAAHTFTNPNIVANTPRVMFHIKMKYINSSQSPNVAFATEPIFHDQQYTSCGPYSDTGGGPFQAADCAGATGSQITDDTFDSSGAALSINTWTGTTSTDWDTATNWSLGTVPTGTTNVSISDVANDPVASGAISVNHIALVNAGARLTVNGAITNTSNIAINSGASLIAKTSVSGNITYHRSLTTTNWYLVSSPVTNQDIDAFVAAEGLASGSNNNRGLATYDNNSMPPWQYYQNGASGSGNFIQGEGRSIKLAAIGDIAFTGAMPVSDVGIAITSNTNGFNLVGNPYPSFIPANTNADGTNNVLTINSSSLTEQTVWFWNQGTGTYQAVNQASSARYIAPAQGFFVSSNGSNTFNFTEVMQSHQTDNFQRNANTRPEIKLLMTDGNQTKETEIFYIPGTTTGWDNGYDSTVFGGGNNSFSIYTQLVSDNMNQDLSIQSLPDSNYEQMVIPVGVNVTSGTEITFSTVAMNIPNGLSVILEDRVAETYTVLDEDSDVYIVTLSEDHSGIGRFYLHVNTMSTLSAENLVSQSISMYTTTPRNLRVLGLPNQKAALKMYSVLGQQVFSTTFNGTSVNDIHLPRALKSGVYIVQVKTALGNSLQKKIILE